MTKQLRKGVALASSDRDRELLRRISSGDPLTLTEYALAEELLSPPSAQRWRSVFDRRVVREERNPRANQPGRLWEDS
jgi:hypothetical protein